MVVLGINYNDSHAAMQAYIIEYSLNYPILMYGSGVYNDYGDGYVPYNVIINKYGIVSYTTRGFNPTEIESHLNDLTTGIDDGDGITPDEYRLLGNYPNPFNPETTIRFSVPRPGFVSLAIFNVRGEKIKTLMSDNIAPGIFSIAWNGTNDTGRNVASGVYIYRLQAGGSVLSKKLILIR